MEPKPVGSYPPSGLNVLVVGTGLAGLTASIECIRKGHNVQVLERNASINTAGKQHSLTKITWLSLSLYLLLHVFFSFFFSKDRRTVKQ